MLFASWSTVLVPLFRAHHGSALKQTLSLTYPASDVVMVSLVIILFARAGKQNRGSLALVMGGIVAFAVSDTAFIYLTQVNNYDTGTFLDTGWVAGYLLISLGALWAVYAPLTEWAEPQVATLSLVVPYVPVIAVVSVTSVEVLLGHRLGSVAWIMVFVLAVLVLGRQVVILSDRVTLGRLVAERTEELEASQREVIRRERLSAVGEMATMIGHELRNPLAATTNALFVVRSRLVGHDDADLDRCLDIAELATSRATALCEDLTTFMRERQPLLERLDLREVIDEVLALAPRPSGTDVSVPEPGVAVEADKALLIQMLTNVISNAYQAMPDGGSLRLDGSRNGSFTEITVQDSGPGIHEANAERLFDPFFSTKTVGTGLGLAIVKRLAEAHNGSVAIDNAPTGGALVTIHLPRPATEA